MSCSKAAQRSSKEAVRKAPDELKEGFQFVAENVLVVITTLLDSGAGVPLPQVGTGQTQFGQFGEPPGSPFAKQYLV